MSKLDIQNGCLHEVNSNEAIRYQLYWGMTDKTPLMPKLVEEVRC